MLTRRIGAACDTAQKLAVAWQPSDLAGHVDGQVRQRTPEVVQREAVDRVRWVGGVETPVVDVDVTVDGDVGRRRTEAGDLRVVADLEDQRIVGGAVGPRLEQQRIALCAHLVVDLLRVDGIDRGLDVGDRHGRVEDLHVRTEVGCAGGRSVRWLIRAGDCGDAQAGGGDREHHGRKPGERAPSADRAGWCWAESKCGHEHDLPSVATPNGLATGPAVTTAPQPVTAVAHITGVGALSLDESHGAHRCVARQARR